MAQSRIITLTANPTVDKNTSLNQVVAERKLRCDMPAFEPGGGGVNVARAVQKMGGRAEAVVMAGGAAGRRLLDCLEDEKVKVHALDLEDETRENFIAFERSSSLQYRFGMPGPTVSAKEREASLSYLKTQLQTGDYLVASGSLPQGLTPDYYGEVAHIAEAAGARCIVDTSGEALKAAADTGVYVLKCNLSELREIVDDAIEDEDALRQQACALIGRGRTKILVVSLGAGGAFVASAQGIAAFRSPTVPIRSKVGAGDSMVGGLTYALAREWPLNKAMRYGVAAGAAAVMTAGTELCRGEDVERLFALLEEEPAMHLAMPLDLMD